VYQRNQGWIFHYNDGWKLGPEPALQQQMAAIGEHMKGGPEFCEKLLVGSWGSVAAAPLTPWVASGAPVVAGQSYGGSIATSLWGQTAVKVGVAAGGAVLGAEAISNPGQTWEFIQQATAEGLSVGPAFPIMVAGRAPGAISNFGRGSLRWPQWAKPEVWRVVPGCNSFGFQLERVAARSVGSGPSRGFIEVSESYSSVNAVKNFQGKGTDFIFDTQTNRFVMGNNPSGHTGIANVMGVAESQQGRLVGGTIYRENGVLMTNEHSGHFGHLWNDANRAQFQQFMNNSGVGSTHSATWGR
jgi:hypothetical protein